MKLWQKIGSTLSYLFGFYFISLTLHEFFHFITLYILGGKGYITFSLLKGFTHFTSPPKYIWLVHLSGGLLTAIFLLLIFWFWPHISKTSNDLNLEIAAFTWAIANLLYAIPEVLGLSLLIGTGIFALGFSIAALIYFVRLSKWFASKA